MKKISLVLILFISFFSITEDREVVFEGKKFVITLPVGYCDQTDELMGQLYLPQIKQNLVNIGETDITPVMAFSSCAPVILKSFSISVFTSTGIPPFNFTISA